MVTFVYISGRKDREHKTVCDTYITIKINEYFYKFILHLHQ